MLAGFVDRVGNIDERQSALRDIEAKVAEIVSQKEAALDKIGAALADLDKQAADLQSQLGELGGPLKVVSFKLAQLAPLMPLIVGLALGGITLWTADGLRRMSLAARLAGEEGEGRVVRTWLASAAGGSRPKIATLETSLGLISVAWVVVAARSVSSLAAPFLTPAMILTGAILVVVAARLYHWSRAQEALAVGNS